MACQNADTFSRLLTQAEAEAAVLCLINEERANEGIDPLTLDPALRAAAREHANAAKAIKWWAGGGPNIHTNPVTGTTPDDRIKTAGYCPEEPGVPTNENGYSAYYRGGNEHQGRTTPRAAVTWWMNSDGHRETLLDPNYTESGVGVVLGVAERGDEADIADGGVIVVETFGGCAEIGAPPGELWSWGKNIQGQLGDGSTTDRHSPVHLEKYSGFVALSGGGAHSFALHEDGSVWAWGFNALGQLGDGTTTSRLYPSPLGTLGNANVEVIAAGNSHSLALLDDGTVLGWGANAWGQVGDGTFDDRHEPVPVVEISGVTAIRAGFNFNLALARDGTVWSWGENNWGQLGDGTTSERAEPRPVRGIGNIIAICAGFEHGLALADDGTLWGWGSNHAGQLGDVATTAQRDPVRVDLHGHVGTIVGLGAGGFHSVALDRSGRVWSWGDNSWGQLGDGTNVDSLQPVQAVNLFQVNEITVGFGHTVALKTDGSVWAWGYNGYGGQVGDGTTIDRSMPVPVHGLRDRLSIAAGTHHTLAI